MIRTIGYLTAVVSLLTCTSIICQETRISYPQPNEDRYTTVDFGNCTFAKGKDRSIYVQPYVACTSGIKKFVLVPQEDGTWAFLVTSGDETDRSNEEDRSSMLKVTIKVDGNDAHEFSMIWPRNMNMALHSVEFRDLLPLLDELRRANSMTISRNDEVIEFDLSRANQAFTELVFEQSVALTRVEKTASQ
ncbi:MAG: hypothetical protein OXG25_01640 [Gammaproteobacteria bacterium]|nr:hypothetical protein [Gammaproteobacteria bacterium]